MKRMTSILLTILLVSVMLFGCSEDSTEKAGNEGTQKTDSKQEQKEKEQKKEYETQVCVGVDNPGSFKIHLDEYDGESNKQSAVFSLEF